MKVLGELWYWHGSMLVLACKSYPGSSRHWVAGEWQQVPPPIFGVVREVAGRFVTKQPICGVDLGWTSSTLGKVTTVLISLMNYFLLAMDDDQMTKLVLSGLPAVDREVEVKCLWPLVRVDGIWLCSFLPERFWGAFASLMGVRQGFSLLMS